MKSSNHYKTWVEISRSAVLNNFRAIKSILAPQAKFYAVVKSNAYGHGLILFSKLADKLGVDGFCVDSVVEGVKLRQNGIKKAILVLGPTLPPNSFHDAYKNKITLTISNYEGLKRLLSSKYRQEFHLKIDTGMHRQGFYVAELPAIVKKVQPPTSHLQHLLTGIYTHFAAPGNREFTEKQFKEFQKSVKIFEQSGFTNLMKHVAATGGVLVDKKYHLDAVRIGIGLYGLWPSEKLKKQMAKKIKLQPVLLWRSIISEIKELKKGDRIGYDLTEGIARSTKIVIVPIGYWHGFDRGLSGKGEVLIHGKRAKVLGRVSMDFIAVDATGINCIAGDRVTLLAKDGKDEISAEEIAGRISTNNYEVITRINPLIE